MKRKINLLLTLLFILIITGCIAKTESTEVGYTTLKSADFKNDSTIIGILDIYVRDEHYTGAIFVGYYSTDNDKYSGNYPVEINISNNSNKIIKNKIEPQCDNLICGNNVIALINTSYYTPTFIQLISKISYEKVTGFALPAATYPLDMANDDRLLYNTGYAGVLCEYKIVDATTNTVVTGNIAAAKYNPADSSVIAYVAYIDAISKDHLFTVNSNGTANTDILAGYSIWKICWSHDGNSIVFATDSEIYRINKDGLGLVKLADFTFPAGYGQSCIKHDRLVFAGDKGIISYDF